MDDAPLTNAQREAIRRHARAMAVRMGYAKPEPEQQAAPAVQLPTENVFALRGLLSTGRLIGAQADAARAFLAKASASAPLADGTPPSSDHTPEDAA